MSHWDFLGMDLHISGCAENRQPATEINGLTPWCRRPPFKGGGRRYHGKAGGTPSKAAAEGFEVLRPSKAAAGVWRVLRGAQNVPRSSFEAQ